MTSEFHIGDTVLCDMCNEDYTNSLDQGGIMFGSKAVCPKCTPRITVNAAKFNELDHIKSYCPIGVSFADWIRTVIRKGAPASMKITQLDDWIY